MALVLLGFTCCRCMEPCNKREGSWDVLAGAASKGVYKVARGHLATRALHLQQGSCTQPSTEPQETHTVRSQIPASAAAAQLHHSSTSPSAPAVNNQGCVGWKAQSSTPEELTTCISQHSMA